MRHLHLVASMAWLALMPCCKQERVPLETELTGGSSTGARTSTITAGSIRRDRRVKNPFEGNAHAEAEGKRYYDWFNCNGCHGALGGGSMGPPLMDKDWIYGGDPQQIYDSIMLGRPQGMPAFGGRLPEDVAWKLVAYVQTLGGTEGGSTATAGSADAEDPKERDRERTHE